MRRWLPSVITLTGALAATLSLFWAGEHAYWACNALIAAALCDMLDGRAARALNAQSAFGEQLDSLVDVIAFGVAPAFLAFRWRLSELGSLSEVPVALLPCFVFVAASAVRLARFNSRPDADPDHFQGIPTPVAALLVVTFVMTWHETGWTAFGDARVLVGLLLVASALMVLPVPFRSFKHFERRWTRLLYFGSMAGGLGLLILRLPGGSVLFGLLVLYVASGAAAALFRGTGTRVDAPA